MNSKSIITSSIVLALGFVLAAFLIGNTLLEIKLKERSVMVRGLAEQEVPADLAIWPIPFKQASNDLLQLNKEMKRKEKLIKAFLLKNGFSETDFSKSAPRVTDFDANQYYGNSKRKYRYIAQSVITLKSTDIKAVKNAMNQASELMQQGVVIGGENYEHRSEFLFTSLNSLKPEMIASATKNAREAAEKFAKDSDSKVGKIKKAHQGLFSINNRDRNTPDIKKIRVVTSVEFYLED